ncbi:DUF1015 domain-containing protein [Thermoproteota archaeon]
MVIIKPFQGIKPRSDKAESVASPPYDVLNSDEARIRVQGGKNLFLHVVKSEIDFPKDPAPTKEDIFKKGAENLQKLIQDNLLVQDPTPCFYIYKQQMGSHSQYGLVAGASVEEYNSGTIKKHEHTRRDKEDDRTRHVEVLNANTGPVFLTYHHRDDIDTLVNNIAETSPEFDFTADDGIQHTLWTVNKPEDIERIQDIFSHIPFLYVADGHHRSAAASRVQVIKKSANPTHTGNEPYNYFLSVIFPDNQMYIMDYNRCLKDLNGLEPEQIMDKLSKLFDIQKLEVSDPEQAKPSRHGEYGMFFNDNWFKLTLKPGVADTSDPVESLDAAILQKHVLEPIFGIDDPRTNNRIDFVGGIRGLKELERRCHTDCKLAFAMYPTGIDQLMSVADAGKVMPPKSTWFEPKLRSGVVVKSLD